MSAQGVGGGRGYRCFHSATETTTQTARGFQGYVLASRPDWAGPGAAARTLVTTATVRMPASMHVSAITGAAPVPVPPPIPAVMNTMWDPSIISKISSFDSNAACATDSFVGTYVSLRNYQRHESAWEGEGRPEAFRGGDDGELPWQGSNRKPSRSRQRKSTGSSNVETWSREGGTGDRSVPRNHAGKKSPLASLWFIPPLLRATRSPSSPHPFIDLPTRGSLTPSPAARHLGSRRNQAPPSRSVPAASGCP